MRYNRLKIGRDDVGSIVEPTSSLVWAGVIPADFQRVISCYVQNISTYLSCNVQRVLRTTFLQKSKPKYAYIPNKVVEVWIDRFSLRYDWSVSPEYDSRCTRKIYNLDPPPPPIFIIFQEKSQIERPLVALFDPDIELRPPPLPPVDHRLLSRSAGPGEPTYQPHWRNGSANMSICLTYPRLYFNGSLTKPPFK